MGRLYDLLLEDYRFREGLSACMNCGICTAICPAAEFHPYDPRKICDIVQRKNDDDIEELLKSETIWYCGECMSCKTRCPRGNAPGLVIMSLRALSQRLGYFTESEKGRQQFAIKDIMGGTIMERGYCVHPDTLDPDLHPEQGPIWKWYRENLDHLSGKLGAFYNGKGPGALRAIDIKNLDEIQKIFEVTGAKDFYADINNYTKSKQGNMTNDEYFQHVYTTNNGQHGRDE